MARDNSLAVHHPFFTGVHFRPKDLAPDPFLRKMDREKEMLVAREPLQNGPMRISLTLNVLLAVGIIALLPTYGSRGPTLDTSEIANDVELERSGRNRARVRADFEHSVRIVQNDALVNAVGVTTPTVSSSRRRRN